MARTVPEIEAEIRGLAAADRTRLLRDLIADLDGAADSGVEAAWLEEAQKRHGELRAGKVDGIPAEKTIKKARAQLRHDR